MRGLRARLVVVFVALAGLSALTAAGLVYKQARDLMLTRTEWSVVNEFRLRVSTLTENMRHPPGRAALQQLANGVAPAFLDATGAAVYGDSGLVVSGDAAAALTPDLRRRVAAERRLVYQRVVRDGDPYLVVGTPVLLRREGTPSGVEVYLVSSLHPEAADQEALVAAARNGVLPVLLLAVLFALVAAGGVLRPVRDLDRAARRLGAGELDTRLKVTGRDELARLVKTFNATAEALETNVSMARRFVADVSHELRTPLASILAMAEVIEEESARLDGDLPEAARLLNLEAGRLVKLVEDLMEISRFDAGAVGLVVDDVDVAQAVAASLRTRGWTSDVEVDIEPGVRVRLDPRRFDVVMANLVGNALRHGAKPVTVTSRPVDDVVVIEVADMGPGVDPDLLPRVFDRFSKADAARTRSDGSGLGLAIALENARLHGGTIEVVNRPEGGALFRLTLPREPR
ncbi:HAMP domain-containing sensor histidine kinase [Herbidospora sp. NBRC 101105]|uniref:sensor histidine kinase n=1 Tax=Herbidospora sp. NBRC 101105 TaxID=3032195 RepID=UPI0024A0BCB4|nr:HAMP domain-containing sensor histidine kinase [Herbidospora sp. NBRC 101105]GLX96712.1 two-component sensor histidine kinase [Herbidospora sp. NBRC 101105]